ncbi:MAG: hypothetical protein KDB53_12430, partial [Planctomycetes bacterium]|nr:hypothetical protein [Planctomycetota bacterium]
AWHQEGDRGTLPVLLVTPMSDAAIARGLVVLSLVKAAPWWLLAVGHAVFAVALGHAPFTIVVTVGASIFILYTDTAAHALNAGMVHTDGGRAVMAGLRATAARWARLTALAIVAMPIVTVPLGLLALSVRDPRALDSVQFDSSFNFIPPFLAWSALQSRQFVGVLLNLLLTFVVYAWWWRSIRTFMKTPMARTIRSQRGGMPPTGKNVRRAAKGSRAKVSS